ncbi:MAG: adenosylcobinamide-GDP ribazoletransferase [Chitinophagaceae bacterium]|nr:MAG: adenosylcobinamide-GDP ribazoletransferase [Chitinophagaceae bacterium]
MRTLSIFLTAFSFLFFAGIPLAQQTQGSDSSRSGTKMPEYAGVKEVQVNSANTVSASYGRNANERVINDTELTFSGQWEFDRLLARSSGYFCNTRSTARQDGAQASYSFTDCEAITWYAQRTKVAATAEVYIDKVLIREIDCTKPGADGVLFNSGPLARGPHRITIIAKSGPVEIDRLLGFGKVTGPVTIDAANRSFVQYTAGFKLIPASRDTVCSVAAANEDGEEWEFYSKGPTFRCYGETGPDAGTMRIFVNDKKFRDISLVSKKKLSGQLLFELQGLPIGRFNRIKGIVLTRGRRVAIEKFVITDAACLMVEMNRQTDIEIAMMARHETKASDPSTWKPVKMGASPALHGVSLGPGLLQTVFDRNVNYLGECLKKPHWVNGKDGDRIWIDILSGSNEGRMLGGMGHSLRYKEIPEFRKAIDDILEEIDRRQYANGRGYMMPYESVNYKISTDTWPLIMRDEQKNYDRAMLTKGMLAAGSAGHEKAYKILRPFYDWYNNADEYLPLMLLGSMGIQGSIAGPMVYHSPVGKPADIQTNMKYYDMDWWLEALADGHPEAAWRFTLNRPHNYLLTSVCALFDIYKATGEEKYLKACLGAWKIYSEYFQIPGGGISLCEHNECRPKSHRLTNRPVNVYETCGSVFWIDLNQRLLQLQPGEEKYAAEIERSLFNGVFAAQAENGDTRYFNQVNEGKFPSFAMNTCCEIQETAINGMLPQYIYSQADDGVFINLFAESAFSFKMGGQELKLSMATAFPYGKNVKLTVSALSPVNMKLRVRVPTWLDGDFALMVNGKKAGKAIPGSYVTLDRAWKEGDVITWEVPMGWKAEQYIGETRIKDATRYAFSYGPMLMALKGPMMPAVLQAENEPSVRLNMTPEQLISRIKAGAQPCEFSIDGIESFTMTPYFSTHEGSFTCFPGLDRGRGL